MQPPPLGPGVAVGASGSRVSHHRPCVATGAWAMRHAGYTSTHKPGQHWINLDSTELVPFQRETDRPRIVLSPWQLRWRQRSPTGTHAPIQHPSPAFEG